MSPPTLGLGDCGHEGIRGDHDASGGAIIEVKAKVLERVDDGVAWRPEHVGAGEHGTFHLGDVHPLATEPGALVGRVDQDGGHVEADADEAVGECFGCAGYEASGLEGEVGFAAEVGELGVFQGMGAVQVDEALVGGQGPADGAARFDQGGSRALLDIDGMDDGIGEGGGAALGDAGMIRGDEVEFVPGGEPGIGGLGRVHADPAPVEGREFVADEGDSHGRW